MSLEVVETLCRLVEIPSVNPMGRAVSGDEYFEHALTDYLQRLFQELRVPFLRQQVAPQRENIVARLDGDLPVDEAPLVVFEVHQDTVPVDGMTIDPWKPQVHQGRVTGRGACDIKGGMACMLSAFARLVEQRPSNRPHVVLACSVNEEHGFTGAQALAQLWAGGTCPLVPRVPDAVIVSEPTLLNVVVAHKGVVRWQCHTHGRAAHSSQPHRGENAIYAMGRVLKGLEEYATHRVAPLGHHPLVGSPTLSVGIISGGVSVNTVPDRCTIEIDRRLLPDEDPGPAQQAVIRHVAECLTETEVTHDEPYLASSGLSDTRNAELAKRVREIAQRHGGPGELIGVPYGTDAPAFDQIGAPTVVFGPGSIEQAHTCDEWVAVEQLQAATEIYYELAAHDLVGQN
jgi:acetylornithine deacetylase